MDGGLASAGMSCPAPGAERQPETALHRTTAGIASWMPVLFPLNQLGCFCELELIKVGPRGVVEILEEHVQRVHVDLGCQVLKSRTGDVANLRMAGRAPGSSASRVDRNRRVIDAPVG